MYREQLGRFDIYFPQDINTDINIGFVVVYYNRFGRYKLLTKVVLQYNKQIHIHNTYTLTYSTTLLVYYICIRLVLYYNLDLVGLL
jgi:hypothetical protein